MLLGRGQAETQGIDDELNVREETQGLFLYRKSEECQKTNERQTLDAKLAGEV